MKRQMFIAAGLLGLFAIVSTGILLWVHTNTAVRIAENQQATLLKRLNEIVPAAEYDNTIDQDFIEVSNLVELGSMEPTKIYLATYQNKPVAGILSVIAPDGYSGKIKLLVGVYMDGTISGVRVVAHKETPGLGDAIEISRSDWIKAFANKSLGAPVAEKWKVKPDGGAFDSLTGATITPRAVVKAVYKALLYFEREKENLFNTNSAN